MGAHITIGRDGDKSTGHLDEPSGISEFAGEWAIAERLRQTLSAVTTVRSFG